MIVLLFLLGFIAVAAGMFGLGLGAPVRDTTFGASVLVASSVAITGGLLLVGLALAVSELRRVLQTAMRQRTPERAEARNVRAPWMEPRVGAPGAAAAESPAGMFGGASGADADVIPTRFDTPGPLHAHMTESMAGHPHEHADEAAVSKKSRPPSFAPASEGDQYERSPGDARPSIGKTHRAAASWERFDSIRPSDFREPPAAPGEDDEDDEESDQRTGAAPRASGRQANEANRSEVRSPPLSPADAASAIRPVRVLKSGMINDVGYTLFSDGSIETQTADGLLRFGSIDEFRRHLEKSAG